jgi:transcriptional regulator with XRE-family HTH domain
MKNVKARADEGPDDVVEHHIARRVRLLRASRGMTLKELGDLTGLSKGLLSKIENCNVSPPIGTLSKLARALDVPIGEFFESDDPDPGQVFFPKSSRQIVRGRRTAMYYEYELLVSGRRKRDMQPMIIIVDGKTYKFGLQEHPGEQFILMLEGGMEYVVGDQTYKVNPEDCIYFDARLPHGPKLRKNQKACYLVVHTGT